MESETAETKRDDSAVAAKALVAKVGQSREHTGEPIAGTTANVEAAVEPSTTKGQPHWSEAEGSTPHRIEAAATARAQRAGSWADDAARRAIRVTTAANRCSRPFAGRLTGK